MSAPLTRVSMAVHEHHDIRERAHAALTSHRAVCERVGAFTWYARLTRVLLVLTALAVLADHTSTLMALSHPDIYESSPVPRAFIQQFGLVPGLAIQDGLELVALAILWRTLPAPYSAAFLCGHLAPITYAAVNNVQLLFAYGLI